MDFSEKIKNIRNKCGYENEYFEIKIYEYFLITTCLFFKEIIELIITTFKQFTTLFSFYGKSFYSLFSFSTTEKKTNSNNKGIESLFSHIPVLKEKIFWIWIFKILINSLILLYFLLKYGKKFFYSDGMLLWIFIVLNPIIDFFIAVIQKYNSLNIFLYFLEFLRLSILPLIIFYFIKIDKTLINSWKLIFYENLNYCSTTNTYEKNENSFFSKTKIKQLFKWIFISLLIIVLFNAIMHLINALINSNSELTTKNQTALENQFKENKLSVFFSAVLIAPIIEELLMRKCLMCLGKLRWFTVINSAFLFGLIHLSNENIFQLMPYLISGLVFAFLYWSTNNIWNSIFTHAAFNLIAWIMLVFKI